MKKPILAIAITSCLLAGTHHAHANSLESSDSKNRPYIGTGIGAVAGAIFAGPVGFVAGGLLGNLAGRHDAVSIAEQENMTALAEAPEPEAIKAHVVPATDDTAQNTIVIAQNGDIASVINEDLDNASNLKDILVSSLNMDVFFLSGSTSVETFYQPRLNTVAKFMQEMNDVDIHLDGYSDRRGDEVSNLALSSQRLASVRNALLQAGVDDSRIHVNARGEQQFNSKPGNLEAYTFDRRVVIRFEQSAPTSSAPVALTDQDPTI
jgi:outer membrane protein OmpA-like peptidoglycan-associated protein